MITEQTRNELREAWAVWNHKQIAQAITKALDECDFNLSEYAYKGPRLVEEQNRG